MSEICPHCGKEFRNLGAHLRFCKGEKSKDDEPLQANEVFEEPIDSDKGTDSDKGKQPVVSWTPDPELSEGDKLRAFLSQLALYPPSPNRIQRLITKILGRKQKTIVLVADGEEPIFIKVDYDAVRNHLVVPDVGYYRMPTRSNSEVVFFHKNYMLPLVDCPHVQEEFDTPADQALSIQNAALIEGRLKSFDELIGEIRKWQLISTMSLIAVVIIMIGAVVIVDMNISQTEELLVTIKQASGVVVS